MTVSRLETAVHALLSAGIVLAFSTSLGVQFTLPKLLALSAGTVLIAVSWIWRVRRGEYRALPPSILMTLLALAIWWGATAWMAVDRRTALSGAPGRFDGLWTSALLLSLFALTATAATSVAGLWTRTKWLLTWLACAAAYTLAQAAGWDPVTWPFVRPASTIGQPVTLATALGIGAPVALTLAVSARRSQARILWGAMFVLLTSAAALTQSRGPLIALCLSTVTVFLTVSPPRGEGKRALRRGAIAVVVLLIAAAGYVVYSRSGRLFPTPGAVAREPEIRNRLQTVGAAAAIVRDHPWTGVGLENYHVLYPRYRPADAERVSPDAVPTMVHSGYLQVAVGTGVPGLLLYVAFLAAVLRTMWSAFRATADPSTRLFLAAALASVIGFSAADASGWPEVSITSLFYLMMGAGVSAAAATRPVARPIGSSARVIATAAGCAVALLAAIYTWQIGSLTLADLALRDARVAAASGDWTTAEQRARDGLARANGRPEYIDQAGLVAAQQFGATGDRDKYDAAAQYFEAAWRAAPYNEYYALHRIDLDTAALGREKGRRPSPAVEEAVAALTSFDHHNGSIDDSIARLRFAEGRPADALMAIHKAQQLRPERPDYTTLEGDILRALGDRPSAAAAYRHAIAHERGGSPEWLNGKRRLVVTLLELGQREGAAAEAQDALHYAPADSILLRLQQIALDRRPGATGS